MSESKPKRFRNPTPEEVEQIIGDKYVEASAAEVNIVEAKTEEPTQEFLKMKKSQSKWEPKGEPVQLISGNKVISSEYLTDKNEVFVRRLTSREDALFQECIPELRRNNDDPTTLMNIMFSKLTDVIDKCLVTNIRAKDLSLVDKYVIFMKIVSLSFKDGELPLTVQCEKCNTETTININVYDAIDKTYVPKNFKYPLSFKTTSYEEELVIFVEYFNCDEDNTLFDFASTLEVLKAKCVSITYKNGQAVDESEWSEILENLNEADLESFKTVLAEFGKFGTTFEVTMPICNVKQCSEYKKETTFTIPIQQIFQKLLKINK